MTDLEETYPQTDNDGDLQYYCTSGHHTFKFNENGYDDDDD